MTNEKNGANPARPTPSPAGAWSEEHHGARTEIAISRGRGPLPIDLPDPCLVVLVGPSGAGKSSFALKHFKPTEVLSSDACRAVVADDETDQSATRDAFDILHYIARKRLAANRLTVVDATSVQVEARKPLVRLARDLDCLVVAIVLNLSPELCETRNISRPGRNFGPHVLRQQAQQLRRSIKGLRFEGFHRVWLLTSPEEVDAVTIKRRPLWNDLRHERGPFDIIGDVHGCYDELVTLLTRLGYEVSGGGTEPLVRPPECRKAVFVGDLVDRGPKVPAVLRLVMSMVEAGTAFCVPGNHDVKLLRKLRGRDVRLTHGLAETLEQLQPESEDFRNEVAGFIDRMVSHFVLDEGRLVVAHAGLKEAYHGRASGRVREFALYGETTGETDEFGLPVRYDWAGDYRGRAMVVYGHTPVPVAHWLNHTICLDTGCVFGGCLTALRYPERELLEVPAQRVSYRPVKPLKTDAAAGPQSPERPFLNLLDVDDVLGKRIIETRIHHTVTIQEENAAAALEVMSRFAIDPRWLIYLPPTMSPPETRKSGEHLEFPIETFDYYAQSGISSVVCEEKHMGSRAVLVLCRDAETAKRRFGMDDGSHGALYTRTGRPFFNPSMNAEVLERVKAAVGRAGLWEELETDWICLDCELMPWSAKALELLRTQYAAVGSASRKGLEASVTALEKTVRRNEAARALLTRFQSRREAAHRFVDAYRRYCWPVKGVGDLKIAPFHVLASEGRVYIDESHVWHMETLAGLSAVDPSLFCATAFKVIQVNETSSVEEGVQWWTALTAAGGEGMVVKPMKWLVRGPRGLIQPAIKCRGREYLRIIYGPEYALPEHLERLRARQLGGKRSLALREFALGLEGLHRFVEKEPLYRVHECVFGVLALESVPVDPRL